jgi:hypothetical protein
MATTAQTPEPKTATVPKAQAVPAQAKTLMTSAELRAPLTRRTFLTHLLFLSLGAFGVPSGGAWNVRTLLRSIKRMGLASKVRRRAVSTV